MNTEKRIHETYTAFDNIEIAQQFIGGFKDDTCLEQKSAYYISLELTNDAPRDIFICDLNCELQHTKNEEHNICFYGGPDRQHGLLISKVFADSEEEALRKVIEIRNEAVVTGEWDLAWERHLIQQSKFKRKNRTNT
ncbi:hypothetical protein AQ505_09815 [Pedobacter sp. PACM 27299]|uniref:hypothetical protein n=1 Tax=Pedobacter sp. PACM 27299 TaxID=1727164 RepID=UPI0007057935|nr:hypothetical protein [Pedobacter sp. PACM 27299]ALL05762.1 hypothetical protein AQ505_09815 [Pedobacter sp. PACM 27299]